MDTKALHEYVEKHHGNISEIVAIKDGETFYKDTWHGYAYTDAANVMSVTKSVTSLLIGIAIDKGLIGNVKQPVLDFFPEYHIKRGEKTIQLVTIEHLLTMTAPYKFSSEPWSRVCSTDDWTKASLDLLGGRAGITGEYKYTSLGVHILTGIIAKTSGMPTIDFANRYLFEPIGVATHRNFEAMTIEEHKEFTLSNKPRENVWFCDPMGVNTAGWGLCMTAEDMARIGLMCINKGVCGDRRVVSEEWLIESTKPRRKCDERFGNMWYGYMWWIPDENKPAYAAMGNGGNVIYIDPALGLVVAICAMFKPRVPDRITFIREYIETLY